MNTNLIFESWRRFLAEDKEILAEAAGLGRILQDYYDVGFIVISADRTCEAETGVEKCSEKDTRRQEHKNFINYKKLRKEVRQAGFGFIPAFGGYKEKIKDPDTGDYKKNPDTGEYYEVDTEKPEHSVIIAARPEQDLDHNKLKAFGETLSKRYNQDTFLYKPANADDPNAYYLTKDGQIDMTFNDVTANDLAQQYYTMLRKQKNRRFTMLATESEDSQSEQ